MIRTTLKYDYPAVPLNEQFTMRIMLGMNYSTQTAYAAMDGVSCRRFRPAAWLVPSQKYPS